MRIVKVTRMVRRTIAGFAGLWRRDRLAAELDTELGAYFESAVDQHLRAGLSREDAFVRRGGNWVAPPP